MFTGNWIAIGIHQTSSELKNGVNGVMRVTILALHVLLMSSNDSYEKTIQFSQLLLSQEFSIGWVPIVILITSFLIGEKVKGVRCGSGLTSFKWLLYHFFIHSITTGGGVSSCPIAAELECITNINAKGTLLSGCWWKGFHPKNLFNSERVGEPCTSCDIFHECGGRCLYANQTKWWGEDGFQEVCNTIRHLMKEMHRVMPTVQKKIDEGVFSVEDFHYPPYNNSIETIP